ncbi:hypothetical protein HPB51_000786 [Rhipicephalus microplus]|uniref:Cystatin domain-containing protein n=1 Tax=Rhipicephalus microplus TaxID=6941 RepID=A0A9J6DE37_RHIMP|nr:hypothetical protein HPB51_000786 [Rhipicephalus microplus]
MASPRVGGLSQELKPADATVQEICDKVRSDVEKKLGQNFAEFTPVNYRTQVVNGTNYFVKVSIYKSSLARPSSFPFSKFRIV